jgi:hypothetical protein
MTVAIVAADSGSHHTPVIKVAASVILSCRIVVRLSGSWPNREFCERISRHVSSRPAVAHVWTR